MTFKTGDMAECINVKPSNLAQAAYLAIFPKALALTKGKFYPVIAVLADNSIVVHSDAGKLQPKWAWRFRVTPVETGAETSDETETRAHRENLFRDWLKEAEGLNDSPYPARKPVRAR